MEMMVVLLIVAIIAAASAPMVTKKLSRNAGTGDSPWVFTGLNNNIAFLGGNNGQVLIGSTSRPANAVRASLYIAGKQNWSHIGFGNEDNTRASFITYQAANNAGETTRIGLTNVENIPPNSILIGGNQRVLTGNSIAIGNNITAATGQDGGIAIGTNVTARGNGALAIGPNPIPVGGAEEEKTEASQWATAVGSNAKATQGLATAIGTAARATGDSSTAIGTWTEASGRNSVALGIGSKATAQSSVAIGRGAHAAFNDSVDSVAIGTNSYVNGAKSYAIGYNSQVFGSSSFAIGNDITVNGQNKIYLGNENDTVYIAGRLIVEGSSYLGISSGAQTCLHVGDIGCVNIKGERGSSPEETRLYHKKFYYETSDWKTHGYSDRRLKNLGKSYTAGLDELKKLDFFHYTFKKDESKTPRVGVIAQDLQKVFPDAVTEGEDGYLRIRLEDMFYAVINAVKELDARIVSIVDNIAGMKSTIEAQQKTIDAQQTVIEELQKQNSEFLKQNAEFEKRLKKLEKRDK